MTKTYKIKKNIVWMLSFLCSFGPLIVFSIMGLVQAESSKKLILSFTLIAAIVMGLLSIWLKIHLRSTLFIVMIGLWVALERLLPFIVTIMICTMIDELILTPLYKRWKADYHTNLQIDKRLQGEGNKEVK